MKKEDDSDPDLIEGLSIKGLLESFAGLGEAGADRPALHWDGKVLGSYELIEEIDRGGMGVVFRARQLGLDRIVAVKVLRSGGFAGEDELARFQGEALVLGQLEHPNIVQIFDVGEHDGHPFLAMRFVDGGCLLDHIGRFVADPRLAAEVLVKVASGVHEAHRRGILHRDLKPANILLDGEDEPHITDFGLSRRVGIESSLTATGAVLGSPNYISPEMALGDEEHVTTGTDVYGLGAVLFHLLTGRAPFEGENPVQVLKAVTESEPPRPSSLNPRIDRDLETICLKCLHRDPERRYPSAGAVAADLRHWLQGEPIEARPMGTPERLRRWARRHPAAAIASGLLLAGLIGFLVMNRIYQINLREGRDAALRGEAEARTANRKLEAAIVDLQLERAEQEFAAGRQRLGIRHLLAVLKENPGHRVAAERLQHEWARRRFSVLAAEAVVPNRPVDLLAFSRDGETMAGAGRGMIHLWKADSREVSMPAIQWKAGLKSLELSADGSLVMAASENEVRTWSVPGGTPHLEWTLPDGTLTNAALSPAGDLVYVAAGRAVLVLDSRTGEEQGRLEQERPITKAGLCLSPSGNLLVVSGPHRTSWWDLESRQVIGETDWLYPSMMRFSGDGSRLVVILRDHKYQFWDVGRREPLSEEVSHLTLVREVSLDHTGRRCALGLVAGRLEIFGVDSGIPVLDPMKIDGDLSAMTFRPGHEMVVTASSEKPIRFWDLEVPGSFAELAPDYVSTFTVFTADERARLQRNRSLVAHLSSPGNRVALPYRREDGDDVRCFAFSPDGTHIAASVVRGRSGRVEILDARTLEMRELVITLPRTNYPHYSPDGRKLVLTGTLGGLVIWDCEEHRLTVQSPEFPGTRTLAFNSTGHWFVSSDREGTIAKWSTETGERLATLCHGSVHAMGIAVSSDDGMLLTGDLSGRVRWWRLEEDGATLLGEDRFKGRANWADFSPGSEEMFLFGSRDGSVRVWESATGALLSRIEAHELPITHARFTVDGLHVRTISMDGTARIWDARTGYPVTSPLRHDEWWTVPAINGPLTAGQLEEFERHCRR